MLKYLEPRNSPGDSNFHVAGAGTDEIMPPCVINRPYGRGDWLLMRFHSAVLIKSAGELKRHPANTIMIWEPGAEQLYGNDNEKWDHSWLHCSGAEAGAIIRESGLPIGTAFISEGRDPMNHVLADIYHEIKTHSVPSTAILKNLLRNLLLEIKRCAERTDSVKIIPERIQKSLLFMEENFNRNPGLKRIAAAAGMSVPHFCAEFKKHTGKSAVETIMELRMREAAYLLTDMNLSVSEVAQRTGWSDLFQFSKIFKKYFGASPRKHRANQPSTINGQQ
jgi:AraC-like DNA-binding protein